MNAEAIRAAVEAAVAASGEILDSDRESILAEALKGRVTPDEVQAARTLMLDARRTYQNAARAFIVAERDLQQAQSLVPPNPQSLESARRDREAALLAEQNARAMYEAYQLVEADFRANQGFGNFRGQALAAVEPRDTEPTHEEIQAARDLLGSAIDARDAAQDALDEVRASFSALAVPGPLATFDERLTYSAAQSLVRISEARERAAAARVQQFVALVTRLTQHQPQPIG
jgi:hypothetical protein